MLLWVPQTLLALLLGMLLTQGEGKGLSVGLGQPSIEGTEGVLDSSKG